MSLGLVGNIVGEVPIQVHSPKGVCSKVFSNLNRMHGYGNLPLRKQFSFYFLASSPFCKKEIFSWEDGNI